MSSGTARDILNRGPEFYCDKLRGVWIQLVTIYNLHEHGGKVASRSSDLTCMMVKSWDLIVSW